MKISIAASILILLFAALFGWQNQQHLATVRESHAKLVADAKRSGESIGPSRPGDPVRVTKRERGNKQVDAKEIAAELTAYARAMEAMEKNGGPPDEAQQKRLTEIMDRMMSLDTAQLRTVIAAVGAAKDLTDKTRQGIIGSSLMALSNDQPQAALALFTGSSDFFKGGSMGQQAVASALGKWAKDDSLGALEWVRENSAKFPDLVTEQAKRNLISGTASQDARLAFELIGELGITEDYQAVSSIMNAAKTPADRTATFNALRECLARLPDEKAQTALANNAMNSLASTLAREGFDTSSQWVAQANFNPVELERFSSGLLDSIKRDENDKWIEWMKEKLPADKAGGSIANLFSYWTRRDYQAAGAWLTTAPDGPARTAAVRGFAWVVSEYDPETATQWAMTLPPGNDRERTLQKIYQDAAREASKKNSQPEVTPSAPVSEGANLIPPTPSGGDHPLFPPPPGLP